MGLAGDVTQVATVRQALGPEVAIRVDANGAWSVDDAAERLEALAQHRIELAEQPVGTFEQMVELRRRVEVTIAADESLVSPFDARRARELGACEVAAVKVAKVGGLGRRPRDRGGRSRPTSRARWRDRSGIAAAAHAVQALRARGGDAGVAHGLATERLFSHDGRPRASPPSGTSCIVDDEPRPRRGDRRRGACGAPPRLIYRSSAVDP